MAVAQLLTQQVDHQRVSLSGFDPARKPRDSNLGVGVSANGGGGVPSGCDHSNSDGQKCTGNVHDGPERGVRRLRGPQMFGLVQRPQELIQRPQIEADPKEGIVDRVHARGNTHEEAIRPHERLI